MTPWQHGSSIFNTQISHECAIKGKDMLIIAGLAVLAAAALLLWRLVWLIGQALPACNDDFIFY
jgi:hypothetical protein